jgi:putative transposase
VDRFEAGYGTKHLKAVASLRRHHDRLLTFYNFPAEPWKLIRITDQIESLFATIRLRQRITRRPGSRNAA